MEYLTQAIYEASKSPVFAPLFALGFSAEDRGKRETLAQSIQQQTDPKTGAPYVIDRQIDIWGWPADETMAYRQQLGYSFCGGAIFSSNQIPAIIKVSVNAADYPPYTPPQPPPPPASPVGGIGPVPGVYPALLWNLPAGTAIAEGMEWTAPDGNQVFLHQFPGFGGMLDSQWETAAARDKRIAAGQ